MINEITLKFVGIKPITKQQARRVDTRSGKVRHFRDHGYKIMQEAIRALAAQEARRCGWKMTDNEVECHGRIYVPKGERSPDLDNALTGVIDALQDIIYTNDNRISKATYERFKNIRPTWEIELYFRLRG